MDAWADDACLLVQHGALVWVTEPKLPEARNQAPLLAEGYARGKAPCAHRESPPDAIHRVLDDALANLQALEALSLALGTAETRATAVQAAVSAAGRDKVIEAISERMPFHDRSTEIRGQIAGKEREKHHPKTPQHDECAEAIDKLKTKLQLALDAEGSVRRQRADDLVSRAEAGDLDSIAKLQGETAGSLPAFSLALRKARASDVALAATIGDLIRVSDEKRSRAEKCKACGK